MASPAVEAGAASLRTEAEVRAHRAKPFLSENEITVICERHFGWERATPKLLAAIFHTSPQHIVAVLKTDPRAPKYITGTRRQNGTTDADIEDRERDNRANGQS